MPIQKKAENLWNAPRIYIYIYGPPHMAVQKQDDQHEHTFNSYVRIRVVVLKTCLGRLTIGRSGERGSGISVLPARHDDDDDIYILKFNISCAACVIHKNSKITDAYIFCLYKYWESPRRRG